MEISRQLCNERNTVGSIHMHNYDNSGYGNGNGRVNYVADNKMP